MDWTIERHAAGIQVTGRIAGGAMTTIYEMPDDLADRIVADHDIAKAIEGLREMINSRTAPRSGAMSEKE